MAKQDRRRATLAKQKETVENTVRLARWISQFTIFMETFIAVILTTLFVMAVSRRFRR